MTLIELFLWLAVIAALALGAGYLCERFRRNPDSESGTPMNIEEEGKMTVEDELTRLRREAEGGFYRIRQYGYEDPNDKGTFYFELCSGGISKEPVAKSERYTSKSGAHRGIRSARRWAPTEDVVEDLDTITDRDGNQVDR